MHSATKHSTHLPDNHEALHELFTLKLALCLEEHNVPDELLINADHSACMLLNTSGYGRTEEGQELASISHSSSEKRQFTILPAVALSGDVYDWQLVFQGPSDQCLPPASVRSEYPNLHFSFSANQLPNMATTKEFTKKVHTVLTAYRQRTM